MQCPLCSDETLQPHYRAGIEIDICPRCKGLWLDRGELDRLVSTEAPPAPAPWSRTDSGQPELGRDPRMVDDRLPSASAPAPAPAPSRAWDVDDRKDRDRDRDDRSRDERKKGKKKKKKSKSKRLADALEDLFDDVLDL